MKTNYLFPNKFKRIGWLILIPSAIVGLVTLIFEYEPSFLGFDFSFLWVMIFNMFTVLLFFIIRFNWQISKLKKSANYEE